MIIGRPIRLFTLDVNCELLSSDYGLYVEIEFSHNRSKYSRNYMFARPFVSISFQNDFTFCLFVLAQPHAS